MVHAYAVDIVPISGKERLIIGKLEKEKLRVLNDMLFGNWVSSELGDSKKRVKLDISDVQKDVVNGKKQKANEECMKTKGKKELNK